jgi:hypothetical protein
VMGASFILLFILYQICSKLQPRVHATRIKSRNRAAVIRGVRLKSDRAAKLCRMCPSCREMGVDILKAKPSRPYLLVVIRQLLLLSGDVELNPGPLDGEYSSVNNYRT